MDGAWPAITLLIWLAALAAGLSACSGGGGGAAAVVNTEPSQPPAQVSPYETLTCSGTAGAGWCWQQPRPAAFDVLKTTFLDAQRGWAVGDGGRVWRTVDGGVSWTLAETGLRTRLDQVVFQDTRNGWAASSYGFDLLRTTDGGISWTALGKLPLDRLSSLGIEKPGMLRITGLSGSDNHGSELAASKISLDAGASWSAWTRDYDFELDSGVQWKAGVLWSVDGGKTFEINPGLLPWYQFPNRVPLVQGQGRRVWALVDDGGDPLVYSVGVSDDGGANWSFWRLAAAPGLSAPSGTGRPQLFADGRGWMRTGSASSAAAAWHTTDWGRNWRPVAALPLAGTSGVSVDDLAFIDGRTSWFSSPAGAFITRDGGGSWQAFQPPAGTHLIRRDASGALSAVGPLGARNSVDNGLTWPQVAGSLGDEAAVAGLLFTDSSQGLALRSDGTLLVTTDGGLNWSTRSRLGSGGASAGWLHRAGASIWLVDADGALQRSRDDGRTWQLVSRLWAGGATTVSELRFFDELQGYASVWDTASVFDRTGLRTTLLFTRDGGLSWQPVPAETSIRSRGSFANISRGIAFLDKVLKRTEDGGLTWQAVATGSVAVTGPFVWQDSDKVWSLGLAPGQLARSDDAGRSWRAVPLPTVGGLAAVATQAVPVKLAFVDALRGWAIAGNGVVLVTADGGATWQTQLLPTQQDLRALHVGDAQRVWVGGTKGVILSTATGGR